MAKVIWTETALNDLKEIFTFILKDSPTYARRVGNGIMEASRKLDPFPRCGRVVPEFQEENIRELIYGVYRIIYQIREDVCYIVAVIHGRRDILRYSDPSDWDIE